MRVPVLQENLAHGLSIVSRAVSPRSTLPVLGNKTLEPGTRALLYDLDWARRQKMTAKVLAAGARIRNERLEGGRFRFTARGPQGTTARARILLPKEPGEVLTQPPIEVQREWDASSSTLRLTFPNSAQEIHFDICL